MEGNEKMDGSKRGLWDEGGEAEVDEMGRELSIPLDESKFSVTIQRLKREDILE